MTRILGCGHSVEDSSIRFNGKDCYYCLHYPLCTTQKRLRARAANMMRLANGQFASGPQDAHSTGVNGPNFNDLGKKASDYLGQAIGPVIA